MIEYPCKRCREPILVADGHAGRLPEYHPACRRALRADAARDRAALLRTHGICPACKQSLPVK